MKTRSSQQRVRAALSAGALALVASVAVVTTASAVQYTGWQTNDGFNRLEGCSTYRDIRTDGVHASDFNACSGDVGVKGQFREGGTVWLTPWDWDYRIAIWKNPAKDWKPRIRVAHE